MALPSIRQLEYFLSAARIGTFAGAAAANHIAQPSLSEQIGSLEQSLQVVLFTRTSRGLLLTDAGKQLVPFAERALQEVRDFAEWSRRLRSVEEGVVSFGTFSSAHLYLLTDLLSEFRRRYPRVRVHIAGLNSSEVADAVRSGEMEAGLVQLPVDARELNVTPTVFIDENVFLSAKPFEPGSTVGVEEIARRPLILSESSWDMADPLRVTLLERAQRAGVRLEPVIEVEFLTHAVELAQRGLGDTVGSYHVARSYIEAGQLHWAPLEPPIELHFAFITRKGGSVSPATAAFMGIAHRLLQSLATRYRAASRRRDAELEGGAETASAPAP